MDVNGGRSSYKNTIIAESNEEDQMMMEDLRRGPWTVEEDNTLMNYIENHGEGRWNSLAHCAGLKRTGKSCRLRWLNYLRPDLRRGNITLEEQLVILQLHSRWGNRWSKIAQHMPGRTDNEIKNYWRTRVQKHAKQLKCDVNSKQFKDTVRYLWMPRLVERIQAASAVTEDSLCNSDLCQLVHVPTTCGIISSEYGGGAVPVQVNNPGSSYTNDLENSMSTAASSDSFGAQVSPISDLTDNYNNFSANFLDYFQVGYTDSLITPSGYYNNGHGINFQTMEQNNQWLIDGGGRDVSDNLLNVEDIWFLQQQFTNNI